MRKIRLLLALAAALLLGAGSANAQFSVYLGGAMPCQDFAAGSIHNMALTSLDGTNGAARMGFTAGVKLRAYLFDGFSFMITADVMGNGLNDSVTDVNVADSCTNARYLNIPIMFGINYELALSGAFAIYAEAAAGPTIRTVSKYVGAVDFNTFNFYGNVSVDYSTEFSLGYQVGGGIKLFDRYYLGVNYYMLGNETVTGTCSGTYINDSWGDPTPTEVQMTMEAGKYKPQLVTLRLGFEF